MMKRKFIVLVAVALMSGAVQAATLEMTPTAPVPGDLDIASFVGSTSDVDNVGTGEDPPYGNDATTYVAMDRGAQGQLFFTGADEAGYALTGVWVQHVLYTPEEGMLTWYRMDPGGLLQIRVTDPTAAETDAFVLASEIYEVTGEEENALPAGEHVNNETGTGTWFHVTLDTPVALAPNMLYGFDLASLSGAAGTFFFETAGIRDGAEGGDPYPLGMAYVSGAGGVTDNTMTPAPGDHVFVVELIPEPTTMALLGLGSLVFLRKRRA